jgi:hypothetical protein
MGRGGVDRVCHINVVLWDLPSVILEKRDATLNAAVDLALQGPECAVRRALQRRRTAAPSPSSGWPVSGQKVLYALRFFEPYAKRGRAASRCEVTDGAVAWQRPSSRYSGGFDTDNPCARR